MEEIIKTLLLEGIDESTIHRVLDVIEEEYEVVDESLLNMVKLHAPEKEDKATKLSSHYMLNQVPYIKKYSGHFNKKQGSMYPKTEKGMLRSPQDRIGFEPGEKDAINKASRKSTLRSISKKGSSKAIENTVRDIQANINSKDKDISKQALVDSDNMQQFMKNRINKELKNK